MTAVRAEDTAPLILNGSRSRGVVSRLRDVWAYRELLANLVRKELKVRYKDSVLGFAWALLNPLLYLVVFSFVFTVMLPFGVPRFGLLFLSGLLAWNLFGGGLTGATGSIVANGPLVQKVWFPREVLPIAAVGAAFINFLFQVVVLVAGLVVFWQSPKWSMMWLIPPAPDGHASAVLGPWPTAVRDCGPLSGHSSLHRVGASHVVLAHTHCVPIRLHGRLVGRTVWIRRAVVGLPQPNGRSFGDNATGALQP